MTNAKKEFINTIKGLKVVNATIWKGDDYGDNEIEYIDLLSGYGDKEYTEFLNKLDFEYDGGYGGQELYGLIGCEDSIWFDRGEYDGSEWWEKHKYPNIDKIIKERVKKTILKGLGD